MAEPTAAPADGLAAGLAAEYALIYAYGVAGAEISDDGARSLAGDAEYSHRDLRDELTAYMAGIGLIPPPPEAAYTMAPMDDEGAAIAALVALEDATAVTWRTVITTTTGDDRRRALDGLSNAASRAALWRRWLGEVAGTTAFPGA
ncbi:DUF4439 domain-containing protein [Phytomonospora endophytica]|uniref:DUF4439 domain-containing protein n=1 Tax=Phytomonospora endophytica TaxID=714109 RepID=A0A841FHH1_9ACTN|nr:DUF4439 domain-containing protein [Phytomonospora endophytica]MBB6032537.1 hypothetical protein [Phytomonospora endophytica]GIG66313.1 hypothetical protein Pen01_26080 [Phytomonospora endophytica]